MKSKYLRKLGVREVLAKYFYYISMQKTDYSLTILFVVLFALFTRIMPLISAQIIDYIQAEDYSSASVLTSGLFVILLLVIIADVFREIFGDRVMLKSLTSRIKRDYVDTLQRIDYEFHTQKSSGSLISTAKRGDGAVFTAFWEVNLRSFTIVFEFLFTLVILFNISRLFGYVLFVQIILSAVAGYFLLRLNIKRRKDVNKMDDKVTGIIVDNMIGFETIKIFANEKWELDRLVGTLEIWMKAAFGYASTFRYIDLVIGTISSISVFLLIKIGLGEVEAGNISTGVFVGSVVYIFDMSRRTFDLIYKVRDLAKSYTDIESYFAVLYLAPVIKDKKESVELNELKNGIEFSNVSFSYHNGESVLSSIDLKINAKEHIAFVGKSGGGKTTLTKLLMRFYDVDSGAILFDGIDIRSIKQNSLRNLIGLVPQEPVLFNESIEYNISYGKIGTSQKEIEDAASKANLHEFIVELPDGYKTIVGERGIKLSGGQKQRLAIARVILEDPDIVIFDEATSQLDSENEKAIHDAYINLIEDKTTITIAHRLSTVKGADRIIVFDDGVIAEEGSHSELIKRKEGIYKGLWSLQTEELE